MITKEQLLKAKETIGFEWLEKKEIKIDPFCGFLPLVYESLMKIPINKKRGKPVFIPYYISNPFNNRTGYKESWLESDLREIKKFHKDRLAQTLRYYPEFRLPEDSFASQEDKKQYQNYKINGGFTRIVHAASYIEKIRIK